MLHPRVQSPKYRHHFKRPIVVYYNYLLPTKRELNLTHKYCKNFFPFYLALFALTQSCKPRNFNNSGVKNLNQLGSSLDLNDLSVIFPPASGSPTSQGRLSVSGAVLGIDYRPQEKPKFWFQAKPKELSTVENRLKSLDQKGFWPLLIPASGKGFLTEQELKAIWGDNIGESGPLTLQAYLGNTKPAGKEQDILRVSVADAKRWRITSFRYDPCPYGQKILNDDGSPKVMSDASKAASLCKPEIRAVAQPVIGFNAKESDMGSKLPLIDIETRLKFDILKSPVAISENPIHSGWYFADFAVHLFYRLTPEQSELFLKGLSELKKDVAPICGTTPTLTVHPCLLRQFLAVADKNELNSAIHMEGEDKAKISTSLLEGIENQWQNWQQLDFANRYNKLILNSINSPYKVAYFSSNSQRDPWMFKLYERGSSSNSPLELAKQKPLAPDASAEKAQGGVADLKKGYSQVVPRGAQLTDKKPWNPSAKERNELEVRKNELAATSRRMFPATNPKFDSLDVFIRTENLLQNQEEYVLNINKSDDLAGLANIQITKNRDKDLVAVASRINNPHLNDEFSADCGSCHIAGKEIMHPVGKYSNTDRIGEAMGPSTLAVNLKEAPVKMIWPQTSYKAKNTDFLPLAREHVRFGARSNAKNHQNQDSAFIFNQFSIYLNDVVISPRVYNETDNALAFIRKWHPTIAGPAGNKSFDRSVAQACMLPPGYREDHLGWLEVPYVAEMCEKN